MIPLFVGNLPVRQLATTPDAIYRALRAMLVATGSWTETNCYFSHDPDPTPAKATGGRQAILTPDSSYDDRAGKGGGGRYSTFATLTFAIHVVDRHVRDQAHRDDFRLNDAATGLHAEAQLVVEALDGRFAVDAAGNHYSLEGIRLISGPTPRFYGPAWEFSGMATRWEVLYQRFYSQRAV